MNTLVFLSQKGGSGKTTLAVHTAVAAEERGERVAIADTDSQGSATMWVQAREAETPAIIAAPAIDLVRVRALAQLEGYTLVVVDSAPHTAPDAVRLAAQADLIVVPCRPTAFDISAVAGTVEIIRAASARAVFVLSACPARAPETEETRTILAGHGYPVFPGQITDRRSFARAVASGRAVTEFETHGRAAEEIRCLWTWLEKEMSQ